MSELSRARWRKSTYSADGNCVEVADNLSAVVAVRDSKDDTGPALVFTREQWRTFTRAFRANALHPAP